MKLDFVSEMSHDFKPFVDVKQCDQIWKLPVTLTGVMLGLFESTKVLIKDRLMEIQEFQQFLF